MRELSRWGSQQSEIRNKARELTQDLAQKDFEGEARVLFEYVRDHIRYLRDIEGVETLHDPVTLLKIGAGDCDDKAILLASLLMSIGAKVRFIAVAYAPEVYSHVWLQVFAPRGGQFVWVDLETTEPLPFGGRVSAKGAVSHMVLPV